MIRPLTEQEKKRTEWIFKSRDLAGAMSEKDLATMISIEEFYNRVHKLSDAQLALLESIYGRYS